uniref:BZIP domain-containing protein n=1 Tax=Acrobeloides nanus TaxID=290746 RepID=A0A914E4B9_9BILA
MCPIPKQYQNDEVKRAKNAESSRECRKRKTANLETAKTKYADLYKLSTEMLDGYEKFHLKIDLLLKMVFPDQPKDIKEKISEAGESLNEFKMRLKEFEALPQEQPRRGRAKIPDLMAPQRETDFDSSFSNQPNYSSSSAGNFVPVEIAQTYNDQGYAASIPCASWNDQQQNGVQMNHSNFPQSENVSCSYSLHSQTMNPTQNSYQYPMAFQQNDNMMLKNCYPAQNIANHQNLSSLPMSYHLPNPQKF